MLAMPKVSPSGVSYVEDMLKVNVREKVYQLDPRPISFSCECYACTHHSIGYIHHLLSTHEMLGSVLLNLFVFSLKKQPILTQVPL